MKVGEWLIVGIDKSSNDSNPVLGILRDNGNGLDFVKTLTGKDAKEVYEKLTNTNFEGRKENE